MGINLDRLEQRIVGVLIEKQLTVPDTYPLTLNSLVSGCNQKSNRDPQITVEDYEVEGALRALMDRGWVVRVERDTGRAHRYAHQVREQLSVEPPDLALLAELLCRGPQAPGALKTRASRMSRFASPSEVEGRLVALASRVTPYVRKLPKRPREQACRWTHLLGTPAQDAEAVPETPSAPEREMPSAPGREPPSSPSAPTPAPPEVQARQAVAGPGRAELESLRERVAQLEDEVAALRARLDRIEG